MEPLISIQKLFIRALFTFLNVITLSFLTKKKKKKVFSFFPLSSYWNRLSPSETFLQFASGKPTATLRTWVCSIVILLSLVVMLVSPFLKPSSHHSTQTGPSAPQLRKSLHFRQQRLPLWPTEKNEKERREEEEEKKHRCT